MRRLPRYLVVIREGAVEIFEGLQRTLGREETTIAVIWDRRKRDRRVIIQDFVPERRRGERRAPPDTMWDTHGFIVVEANRLNHE